MTTLSYVNISLSGFCIAISLIVLLCSLTDYVKRSKLNRLFTALIIFNIGIILSDIVAYLVEGNTELYAYFIIRVANFLHYAFGALILGTTTFYILAYLETKRKVPRFLKDIVISLSALALILTVVSQFTGLYYYIDDNNVYHRGDVFWLSQVIPLSGIVLNICIVLYYRKAFERKFLFFFLSYMFLPMSAVSLALTFYGITFINIATTLAVLVLYIGVQIDHTYDMAMRLKMMDNQLERQGEHYKMLQSHMDEVKKARHDLRHHLSVFRAFVDTGETEKLVNYIDEYRESLPDDSVITYCENYAINSVLTYYLGIAKKNNIKVDAHTNLPEKLSINDTDLCIIFGNCVENAIEACRKVEKDRFINIKSMIIGDMLTIIIDNNYNGKLIKKGDSFISEKDGGGTGVSSVKSIVRKHNGEFKFESKNNVFQVSLMLQVTPL
ncbi:MAG: GHKL domain-containing protein [Oscillospiraceae bacterium]|nr:GHKL domain-containing protein [Oscillospiraceae bacterium]